MSYPRFRFRVIWTKKPWSIPLSEVLHDIICGFQRTMIHRHHKVIFRRRCWRRFLLLLFPKVICYNRSIFIQKLFWFFLLSIQNTLIFLILLGRVKRWTIYNRSSLDFCQTVLLEYVVMSSSQFVSFVIILVVIILVSSLWFGIATFDL